MLWSEHPRHPFQYRLDERLVTTTIVTRNLDRPKNMTDSLQRIDTALAAIKVDPDEYRHRTGEVMPYHLGRTLQWEAQGWTMVKHRIEHGGDVTGAIRFVVALIGLSAEILAVPEPKWFLRRLNDLVARAP